MTKRKTNKFLYTFKQIETQKNGQVIVKFFLSTKNKLKYHYQLRRGVIASGFFGLYLCPRDAGMQSL